MNERERFERWVTLPPFECYVRRFPKVGKRTNVKRFPKDEERYAWPGSYVDISVELAWQAWQASSDLLRTFVQEVALGAYTEQEAQRRARELLRVTSSAPIGEPLANCVANCAETSGSPVAGVGPKPQEAGKKVL